MSTKIDSSSIAADLYPHINDEVSDSTHQKTVSQQEPLNAVSAQTDNITEAMPEIEKQVPSGTLTSLSAQLPVKFDISAGELVLSGAQVAGLHVGSVLTLDKGLSDQTFNLSANGVDFARGELVAVGDFIGVRLTTLLG